MIGVILIIVSYLVGVLTGVALMMNAALRDRAKAPAADTGGEKEKP